MLAPSPTLLSAHTDVGPIHLMQSFSETPEPVIRGSKICPHVNDSLWLIKGAVLRPPKTVFARHAQQDNLWQEEEVNFHILSET
jgi:uncharacterized membrane protein SirB2